MIPLLDLMVLTISCSAIFSATSLLISDTKIAIATTLLIACIMYIATISLIAKLDQNKYIYSVFMDGKEIKSAEIIGENTFFPGEEKMKMYKAILYIMPSGADKLISNKIHYINDKVYSTDIENRKDYNNTILLLSALGDIIVFTLGGVILFSKKQLK